MFPSPEAASRPERQFKRDEVAFVSGLHHLHGPDTDPITDTHCDVVTRGPWFIAAVSDEHAHFSLGLEWVPHVWDPAGEPVAWTLRLTVDTVSEDNVVAYVHDGETVALPPPAAA